MVAVAIVGAAVVGGVSSVAAGNKAASTSTANNAENNRIAAQTRDENRKTLEPYVKAGIPATSAISNFLGLDGQPAQNDAFDNYRNATGYSFRVAEGQKGQLAALGNKGMLNSGAAQKSLENYRQGIASQESQNYLSALQGQQNVGLSAANATAGVGTTYSNQVIGSNNANAETQANAALSTGGAINSTLNSALSAYTYGQGMKSSYGTPALGKTPGYGM